MDGNYHRPGFQTNTARPLSGNYGPLLEFSEINLLACGELGYKGHPEAI